MLQAILAHADYSGVARESHLERALFACDELAGFLTACALVKPSKSILEVEVTGVKKKMKDKAFARAVKREDITGGAELLGLSVDEHVGNCLRAMQGRAEELGLGGSEWLVSKSASQQSQPSGCGGQQFAPRTASVSAVVLGEVDGASGVFDDDGFEAECFAVDGGVTNAKIVGQAAEEEALQVALAEIASEAGGGGVVVFEEGGVAVDVAAEAFAEDEFGVGDVKRGVEGCSVGVLDARARARGSGGRSGLRRPRTVVCCGLWRRRCVGEGASPG